MWRRRKREENLAPKDSATIDQLRQAGADLSQPLTVDHFLYFPSQRASEEVRDALREAGYWVEQGLGADRKNWVVKAQRSLVVTIDSITKERSRLTSLASSKGGEYDGWGAMVPK